MKFKDSIGNDIKYGDTVACATKNSGGGYSPVLTTVVVTPKNYDGLTLNLGICDTRRTTNIINITPYINKKWRWPWITVYFLSKLCYNIYIIKNQTQFEDGYMKTTVYLAKKISQFDLTYREEYTVYDILIIKGDQLWRS